MKQRLTLAVLTLLGIEPTLYEATGKEAQADP